jgi:nucleotide-binding universal stress UspA family protein
MQPVRRILLPTDCSAGARAAGDMAAQMARDLSARIDVVTVVDSSSALEAYGDMILRTGRISEIRAIAHEQALRFAQRHLAEVPDVAVHVRDGNTFAEILQAARDFNSDLIIMGTHGHTGVKHLVIGSVAEKVVRASNIPVMTVRIPA